jgi:predicted nucleic acid-binding protein
VDTFFDSGALIKVYVEEDASDLVAELVERCPQVPFTPLVELEIRNTLRAMRGRKRLSARGLKERLDWIDSDIEGGRLVRIAPEPSHLHDIAENLSARHTSRILCRALDILHVSAAISLGCGVFATGDARQFNLAKAAGLKPIDIFRPYREVRKHLEQEGLL